MADPAASVRVGVRDLTVMADIGVNDAEIGRRQPLIVSVIASIDPPADDAIAATIDYRAIVEAAHGLAQRRIALIETFAYRLAGHCLALGSCGVEVTVVKPRALADGTAFASITLGAHPDRTEG